MKIADFIDRISRQVGEKLAYLVLFMLLAGAYEVFMRYFFNKPTIWVWELNGLLLSAYVALGGGHALLTRTHVRVDVLYDYLSVRGKAIMDLASSLFMFLFLVVLLWQTSKMSLRSVAHLERTQTLFSPPIYPFKCIMAVGVFLFLLQAVSDFIRNLHIAGSKEGEAENGD